MQNACDLGFVGIAALLLIGKVQTVEFLDLRRIAFTGFDLRGHLFDLCFKRVDFGKNFVDLTDHRTLAVKVVALLEVADTRILGHEKFPLVCRQFSGQ